MRNRLHNGLGLALVGLLLLGLAANVAAETKADRLHAKMIALFKAGKYRETIVVTKQLYELTKKAKYLVNIGTCYDQLKEDESAIQYYQQFLREDATSPLRPRIAAKVEEIRTRLNQHKREVTLESEPSGAEVVIDGHILLRTPTTVWLPFGGHEIELRKPGYVSKRARVALTAGAIMTVRYQLQPAKKIAYLVVKSNVSGARVFIGSRLLGLTPLPRTPLDPGTHTLRVVAPNHREWKSPISLETDQSTVIQAELTPMQSSETRASTRKMRLAAWILLGVGAAVIVSAGTVHGLGYKKISDANSVFKNSPQTDADASRYDSSFDKGINMYKAAYALYAVGGAALVTSVVLFFVKPKSSESVSGGRFRLTPSFGPSGAGLDAQLRF
ncbi:MAG: PEGA domain-containing protein [Myxococcales bacterium]|nr:PEGA domain-containing protein [Myxococcales bacterium]